MLWQKPPVPLDQHIVLPAQHIAVLDRIIAAAVVLAQFIALEEIIPVLKTQTLCFN